MRRLTRVFLGAAIIGVFALVAAVPAGAAPAPAGTGQVAAPAIYGFAFADRPGTPSYTANPRMSANSLGGTNTVERHGIGTYTVRMPNLGLSEGGNVQVSAYGENTNRCKTAGWRPIGSTLHIDVVCQNFAGGTADTPFTVQFHRGANDPAKQSAYLLYRSGAVDPVFSYNSRGGANTVTKLATGRWRVDFGSGFSALGGIIHVTGFGVDVSFCKVRGWNVDEAEVRCYTPGGQLVNAGWSLRYQDRHLPNGFAELGGYVWANDHDAPLGVWYSPHPAHNFNMQSTALQNQVRRVATGRYEVRLPSVPAFDAGNPVATGHHFDGISCKVTELFSSGSSSRVDVDCRDAAGVLRDSFFTLSQVTNL